MVMELASGGYMWTYKIFYINYFSLSLLPTSYNKLQLLYLIYPDVHEKRLVYDSLVSNKMKRPTTDTVCHWGLRFCKADTC